MGKKRPEVYARVLSFSKGSGDGVYVEAKWLSESVFPEIGTYFFISSTLCDEEKASSWLCRINGYHKTGLLSDSAAEMLLTNHELELTSVRNEISEKIVTIEVLTHFIKQKEVYQVENSLNILPTYGDFLLDVLVSDKGELKVQTALEGVIAGKKLLEVSADSSEVTNLSDKFTSSIKSSTMFDNLSLTEKRTVIFGKTGRGKTVLSVDLIKGFYLNVNRPVIIFDLQGEYVALPTEVNAKLSLFQSDSEENTKKIQENLVLFSDRQFENGLEKAVIGGLKFDLSKLGISKVLGLWGRDSELDRAWYAETFVKEVQDAFKIDVRTEKNSSLDKYLNDLKLNKEALQSNTQSALRRKFYEVKKYHGDGNDLEKKIEACLSNNKIIIFDLATSTPDEQTNIIELVLSLVLDKNRNDFIHNKAKLLAPLIVLDEAQLYFTKKMSDRDPVVRLFKEGRKFKLSSLMMTQQPSSMSPEVLSQVENIFTFGMTASADMRSLTEIHKAFNSTVAYQIETNRKKYQPFVVTDNMPFAIQIDSFKQLSGDKNKIFDLKYIKKFFDAD